MIRRLKLWWRIIQAYEAGEMSTNGHRCPLDLSDYQLVVKSFQGCDMPDTKVIYAHRRPKRLKMDGLQL